MKIKEAIQPSWIVARREILDTIRDWRQVVPTLLLTFGFPLLMDLSAKQALNFVARYGGEVMGERFVPFLLLMVGFFPVSASLYTALGAFAGEKEQKSLEPLLASPLADWQLYLGKFVGTIIPPLLAAYMGMAIYTIGLSMLANWHIPAGMLVLVMALATVQASVMVAVAVVVSSQTTSVRAAGLLASFIIVPIGALILAESFVIISATPEWLWGFVVGLLLVAVLFIRMGIHLFDREELLVRD
ncbi:MAG: ABC transporter permease subunit, partial [Anaerolineales bacterium]|nr:ABC transporter permease subunit [Anaerolineales bacterium]